MRGWHITIDGTRSSPAWDAAEPDHVRVTQANSQRGCRECIQLGLCSYTLFLLRMIQSATSLWGSF